MNLPDLYTIIITQEDIDHAWAPDTEQARLYHCPLNPAIARTFNLDMRSGYVKVGTGYFAISKDGTYTMYDILEEREVTIFIKRWDNKHTVYPTTFHAVRVSEKPPISAASVKPRRWSKDIETRKKGSDA
jgi:hypothetical protein